jgi:CheY-like chemotaxis protein
MLDTIRRSGEDLLGLLNDILDLSQIETGRLSLDLAPLVPAHLIERAVRLHRPRAADKGLAFEVVLGPGLDAPRLGDAGRILQVLHAVLDNAVKFTPTGAVRLQAGLEAGPGGGGGLVVELRDTGIGMNPAELARAFDDFVQADGGITRRHGGTGLGLSIARRLVGLMGGTITADSAPGAGTRLRLGLPLPLAPQPQPAPEPGPLPAAPVGPESGPLAGLRLLVAEDNLTNQRVLSAMLAPTGAQLTIVSNGRLAVERAAAADAGAEAVYDLLLFDISMPEMDGPSALAAIRRARAGRGLAPPPAIALTANVLPEQVERYLRGGFLDCLAKPVRRADLVRAIARHAAGACAGRGQAGV